MKTKKISLACFLLAVMTFAQTEVFASRQYYMVGGGTQGDYGDPYHRSQGYATQDYQDVNKAISDGARGIDGVAKAANVPLEQVKVIVVAEQMGLQGEADLRLKSKKN